MKLMYKPWILPQLNCALEENHKLKEIFNPDQLVDAILKVISNLTVKESAKITQVTQYHGNANYVGRLRQPKWHLVPIRNSSQQ